MSQTDGAENQQEEEEEEGNLILSIISCSLHPKQKIVSIHT
jgi:hypothetical protein